MNDTAMPAPKGKPKGKPDAKGKGKTKGKEKPKAEPPKAPPKKTGDGAAPKGDPPRKANAKCLFFPKGTCNRGENCPFSHGDPPKASQRFWGPRVRCSGKVDSHCGDVASFRSACTPQSAHDPGSWHPCHA